MRPVTSVCDIFSYVIVANFHSPFLTVSQMDSIVVGVLRGKVKEEKGNEFKKWMNSSTWELSELDCLAEEEGMRQLNINLRSSCVRIIITIITISSPFSWCVKPCIKAHVYHPLSHNHKPTNQSKPPNH